MTDTPTKPEIGHTPDHGIEAAARAHCDFFGGEGWWDAGLLADTKPKAIEAMRVALAAWNHRTPVHDAAHDLLEALRELAHTAGEVHRLGAKTGTQWFRLAGSLITARAALTGGQPARPAMSDAEIVAWRPIDTAQKDGTWILLRGRNSAGFPMIPVVAAWRRHERGHMTWIGADSGRDLAALIADVPPGHSADWREL